MSDSDRPTEIPPPDGLSPHDRPTLVTCLECGGSHAFLQRDDGGVPVGAPAKKPSGTFSVVTCPWCTAGMMTPEQVRHWKREKGT